MSLAATVVTIVLGVTFVAVLLGYLVHRNAERHDPMVFQIADGGGLAMLVHISGRGIEMEVHGE